MIKIDIDDQGKAFLKALEDVPNDKLPKVIRGITQAVHDKAIAGADKHSRPANKGGGMLLQAMSQPPREIPGGYEVGLDLQVAPHGAFVHFGTRPHVILPRDKKALRWVGAGDGFVFAKRVDHPGYEGDPFLYNAADEVFSNVNSIIASFLGN
jgi:hypothetical protein